MSVALRIASPRSAGVLWTTDASSLLTSCGVVCGRIEDNVRLSASVVYATLALSHTLGNYNYRAPVNGIVIARGLKAVLKAIIINDY